MTMVLYNINIEVPNDFPAQEYNEIDEATRPKTSPHKHEFVWGEFASAWNGLGYRFAFVRDYDEEYRRSLHNDDSTPNFDERYEQEKSLYGFFVNGFSTLECFCYGVYAACSMLNASDFPMATNDERKAINYSLVLDKLKRYYPTSDLTISLGNLIKDPQFIEWRELRNFLAHRATPRRHFYKGGDRNDQVDWGNLNMNEAMTSEKRKWLTNNLQILFPDLLKLLAQSPIVWQ